MGNTKWVILFVCCFKLLAFGVSPNINVQFLIGDKVNGTFQGNYNITFGLYPSPNLTEDKALWKESHKLIITQGQISQILGTLEPISYHILKSDNLYIGLSFKEINDKVYIPLTSVPASLVSKYAEYAKEIEFTSDWMKINTQNHRVGIGITQNLTVPFQVVGSANITSLNATGEIHSPDGFNIHKLDYLKLTNLDDHSLSPYDAQDAPTVDVVFVTSQRNVGVGIYVTSDIKSQLHVSGNFQLDHGRFIGASSIQIVGDAGDIIQDTHGNQFLWDSNRAALRAGFSSSDTWHKTNIGQWSTAFGHDNKVKGQYSFSVGKDNEVTSEMSSVGGGISHKISHRRSGIFSGESNEIKLTTDTASGGFMAIVGGKNNAIQGDYGFIGAGGANKIENNSIYSSIVGGKSNVIGLNSNYSIILGGESNKVYGDYSVSFGKHNQIGQTSSQTDGVFMFSDTQIQQSAPFRNKYSDQFLIHATNGVVIGLNNFDNKASLTITEFDPDKVYPPSSEVVKPHSIRTAGDIVAADQTGKLGYLVGDGRFITNIASLWLSDSQNGSIYTDQKRVGIGVNNNANPAHSILHIKQNTYPPNVRVESTGGGKVNLGVDTTSNDGYLDINNNLEFRRNGNLVGEVTTDGEFYVKKGLGINIVNPTHNLEVHGNAMITGTMTMSGGINTSGTITANSFAGDGKGLTDVPVYYLTPQDGTPAKQVLLDNSGNLGIGAVTSNVQALLHVGDSSTTQFRLQKSDDSHSRYSTLSSTSQFDFSFYNYVGDDDKIFSINSKKSAAASLSSLFMISGRGHVGILTVPKTSHALSVTGNINADTFSGNGQNITDVQLNAVQSNTATFNQRVNFEQVIRLKPQTTNPSCGTNDIGSIYAINKSSAVHICACVGDNERKAISNGSSNTDCAI